MLEIESYGGSTCKTRDYPKKYIISEIKVKIIINVKSLYMEHIDVGKYPDYKVAALQNEQFSSLKKDYIDEF